MLCHVGFYKIEDLRLLFRNHNAIIENIRYSDLFENLPRILPDVPQNTIHGTIWDLDKKNEQIIKPEEGYLY